MNGSSMQVMKTGMIDGKTIKLVDKEATAAVNAKVEEINTAFINWLANNDELNQKLARLYNDTFNDLVEPRYNGDNLTIEGANPMLPLKKHQKDVIPAGYPAGRQPADRSWRRGRQDSGNGRHCHEDASAWHYPQSLCSLFRSP